MKGVYVEDGKKVTEEVLGTTQYYHRDIFTDYLLMGDVNAPEDAKWVLADEVTIVEGAVTTRSH